MIVNRVATARRLFERLRSLKDANGQPRCYAILLTGRTRPYDRDELLFRAEVNGRPTGWLPYIRAGRRIEDSLEMPLVVAATQTVEVGADLSFDALVTEAASLDALRQRFGRLDRLGQRGASEAVIIARKDAVAKNAEDAIYGKSVHHTWQQLHAWAETVRKGRNKQVFVDFGVNAMQPRIDQLAQGDEAAVETLQAMLAPVKEAPVMLPTYVDLWCQTSPSPAVDPDVALFLHGRRTEPPDVQVVWRADLPKVVRSDEDEVERYISALDFVPPTGLESLAVPLHHVRSWLQTRETDESLTDLEGAPLPGERNGRRPRDGGRESPRLVLRWYGPDDDRTRLIRPEEIRHGETVIVPAEYGGCDRYGWNPTSPNRVCDIADPCARALRGRPVLRLYGDVIAAWHWSAPGEVIADTSQEPPLPASVAQLLDADDPETREVREALESLRDWPGSPEWVTLVADELLGCGYKGDWFKPLRYPDERGWLLEGKRRIRRVGTAYSRLGLEPIADVTTEDDTSWMVGCPVGLDEHRKRVGNRARALAQSIRLAEEIAEVLAWAGYLHDLGKADPRFQVWLHDGDEVAASAADELLAKSAKRGRDRAANERARERAGHPKGGRHECLSVRLVESALDVAPSCCDRDLVAYLVGAHHGRGRPSMPIVPDSTEERARVKVDDRLLQVACDHRLHRLDSGWTDRFWAMIRHYGYWSLAYLEAILRLADQAVSHDESREQPQ